MKEKYTYQNQLNEHIKNKNNMYYYMYYINYMDVLLTYIFKVSVSNSPRSYFIPNKNQYFNIINS